MMMKPATCSRIKGFMSAGSVAVWGMGAGTGAGTGAGGGAGLFSAGGLTGGAGGAGGLTGALVFLISGLGGAVVLPSLGGSTGTVAFSTFVGGGRRTTGAELLSLGGALTTGVLF